MSLLLFLSGFSVSSCAAWVRKLTERTKWHQFFPHWILFQVVETAVCMDLHKHHSFKLTETIQWLRTPADQYDVWVTVCACDFPLLCYTRNMSAPHTSLWNLSNSIWHLVGPVSYVHWIKKNCFSLGVFHDCVCERKMKTQRDRRNKRQNNNYVPQGQSFKFTGINVISFPPFTANCYTHNDMHVFLRR